jgi:release factor glutamine methyltransferase
LAPREERGRYLPAEDTYLLRDALGSFGGDSCLEMGFGSGAVLAGVSGRFRLAVGTDVIAREEARLASGPRVELVLADRATCFRDGIFDLVFFNPPYLPSVSIEDGAVDGGPTGVEVPVMFLEEALRVLKDGGTIVALLSSEGDQESFLSHCSNLSLQVETVTVKRLFYETLSVFTIQKSRDDAIGRQS